MTGLIGCDITDVKTGALPPRSLKPAGGPDIKPPGLRDRGFSNPAGRIDDADPQIQGVGLIKGRQDMGSDRRRRPVHGQRLRKKLHVADPLIQQQIELRGDFRGHDGHHFSGRRHRPPLQPGPPGDDRDQRGKRNEPDQRKLVPMRKRSGPAAGYCIVIAHFHASPTGSTPARILPVRPVLDSPPTLRSRLYRVVLSRN